MANGKPRDHLSASRRRAIVPAWTDPAEPRGWALRPWAGTRPGVVIASHRGEVRSALRDQLRSGGVTVVAEAARGSLLLSLLDQCVPPPDLVLVDLAMPGLCGGMELAREVHLRFPALAVAVLSDSSDAAADVEARRSGLHGVLVTTAWDGLNEIGRPDVVDGADGTTANPYLWPHGFAGEGRP